MSESEIDPKVMAAKQAAIAGYAIGAHVAGMIFLGLEMGLYGALRDAGPSTSDELAKAAGLHERWVREWLHGQATARVLEYDAATKRFAISPEVWVLLGDPDELRTMRANFAALTYRFAMLDRVPESFRTGLGVPWDDRGARAAEMTELLFRNWYRRMLVPVALPMLDGVVDALRRGGRAADVGCGDRDRDDGNGDRVPESGVPRLRDVAPGDRPGTPARAGRRHHERDVSRRQRRSVAGRAGLRLHHDVRLPARHDAPARSSRGDPQLRSSRTGHGSSPTSTEARISKRTWHRARCRRCSMRFR